LTNTLIEVFDNGLKSFVLVYKSYQKSKNYTFLEGTPLGSFKHSLLFKNLTLFNTPEVDFFIISFERQKNQNL